jgi:hypothetical protein
MHPQENLLAMAGSAVFTVGILSRCSSLKKFSTGRPEG